ncbi:MAG: helix-turn-helix transcriptional regulator [Clostridia bacterium]|nr:helix-turn-helix transcriptional regulator [Clostridia bacterium]
MEIGQRIKTIRLKKGYSQNMLADLAGVSQTHLRRVELVEEDVTVGHLELFCEALGISLKQFFETDDEADELYNAISGLSPKQRILLIEFLKTI